MPTLRTLVTGSLRLLNAYQAGEEPSDDDLDVGVEALNGILDSWSTERLFIYSIKPRTFSLTAGKRTYTLGPGGDFNVTRPLTVQHATFAPEVTVDGDFELPLAIVPTDQYVNIQLKDMESTYPQVIHDDGDSPLRTLSFWPVPSRATNVTLWLWSPLIETVDLDEEFKLPPGYERALRFTLAIELAPEFGKEVTQSMLTIASASVAKIKVLNSSNNLPLMTPNGFGSCQAFNWVTGNLA